MAPGDIEAQARLLAARRVPALEHPVERHLRVRLRDDVERARTPEKLCYQREVVEVVVEVEDTDLFGVPTVLDTAYANRYIGLDGVTQKGEYSTKRASTQVLNVR